MSVRRDSRITPCILTLSYYLYLGFSRLCGVKMSPMSYPDSPCMSSFLKAYLPHSGSQTAAPRRTCRSWSGRAAGLQSGTCCGTRRWSSCTGAAPCPGSPHCEEGWRCHMLGCAWNLWILVKTRKDNYSPVIRMDGWRLLVFFSRFLCSQSKNKLAWLENLPECVDGVCALWVWMAVNRE